MNASITPIVYCLHYIDTGFFIALVRWSSMQVY